MRLAQPLTIGAMTVRLPSVFFRRALLLAITLTSGAALAQEWATPGRDSATTSITGIINSYYPGTAGSVPSGAVSIPIGSAQPGGAAAIAPGDLLIVMQMQSAQINPVNGTTIYLAPAGGLPGGEREGSFKGEGIAGTPRLVYNGAAQIDTLRNWAAGAAAVAAR